MKPSALLLAGMLGLAAPLFAETAIPGAMHVLQAENAGESGGITVRVKRADGTTAEAKTHGEAEEAEFKNDMRDGAVEGDAEALEEWLENVRDLKNGRGVQFGDGDLSDDEIAALEKKAREKLERDMADLQERERENATEPDPDDQIEEAYEIKQARYRASLRALERDLLYRVKQLRKAARDNFEGELDDVEDGIKDTFADLHDKIDAEAPGTWQQTLNTARKFHTQFGADIDKWAEKIGVDPAVPNAGERVTSMKKALIERLKRLRKVGGDKYSDTLDEVEERIYSSFENLEEKIEDSPPANWGQILKDADKFHVLYTSELDGWAKQMGGDESLPRPVERLTSLKRDLKDQIDDLRRIGGEDYEDVIDEIADGIDETFANLKDKLLDGEGGAGVLETAAKYHKQYSDIIDLWERKIVGASDKIERDELPRPTRTGEVEDYPERDVDLGKGEHFDTVEGVRVARLLPLPKRQLGLDHGLAVKEIVDADKSLSRAGVEVYDIILAVGETEVDTRTDLRDAMKAIDKGAEFEIKVMRDGQEKILKSKK